PERPDPNEERARRVREAIKKGVGTDDNLADAGDLPPRPETPLGLPISVPKVGPREPFVKDDLAPPGEVPASLPPAPTSAAPESSPVTIPDSRSYKGPGIGNPPEPTPDPEVRANNLDARRYAVQAGIAEAEARLIKLSREAQALALPATEGDRTAQNELL